MRSTIKILVLFFILITFAVSVNAEESSAPSIPAWIVNLDGSLSPPNNSPITYNKNIFLVTSNVTIPNYAMNGIIHNTNSNGIYNISLSSQTNYCETLIKAKGGHTIEIRFPANANPILNGSSIGVDNEIDVLSGSELLVIYWPSIDQWEAIFIKGVSNDGGLYD